MQTTRVEIKAITDTHITVAGWGVVYGGMDLYGETFTPDTDFMLDLVPAKPVLYDHALGQVKHFIGTVKRVEQTIEGLWVEAELERNRAYVEQVRELIEAGALGWSSGTAGHLAQRSGNVIKSWPIIEFSLTPEPAEPRTLGVEVIKSMTENDPSFGALLPEAEAATSAAGADDDQIDTTDDVAEQEPEMETEVKAAAGGNTAAETNAADMEAAIEAAVKRILAAQPATNAQPVAAPAINRTGLGEDADGTKAFLHYLRTGDEGAVRSLRAYNNTDMNIGTPADGGYAVPTGLYNQIVARRDEMSLVGKLNMLPIPGKGLTVRVPLDAEADVEFLSESEAATIDQDAPALGYKDFTLVKYAKYITLSWELLRDEDAQLEAFLSNWVSRGLAATENKAIITEALANGTAGLTLDAATAIGAAEIPELEGKLMPEYQDGAVWIMHPTTYAYLRGLFGTSQFVFAPAQGGVEPGFGYPVHRSSYATALGASAKSLIFGNFNFMGYRRVTNLNMLRDPYTVATAGQVRFHYWFDFVPGVLQAEAIQYATHPSA